MQHCHKHMCAILILFYPRYFLIFLFCIIM
uniref:Uncharacterized protein n=1 Tax=Anguilla anguilla TaxID=7936 RepID=A0A0E9TCG1_ANGAN